MSKLRVDELESLETGRTVKVDELASKLSELKSIRDFGAVGDGVADDTSALQALLNTGGTVDITAGLQIKFTSVSVPSGVTITSSLGKVVGGSFNVFSKTDVTFEGVEFDYSSGSTSNAIRADRSTVCIKNCSFKGLVRYPVLFSACSIDFYGNKVINCTNGIAATDSTTGAHTNPYVSISNCRFTNVNNSSISLLTNNVVEGAAGWADSWLEQNSYFNAVIISGNFIENSPAFAVVFRGWHCTFTGNIIRACASAIFQGGRITVSGNEIFNSSSMGIDFGNVTSGVIVGNVISKTKHPAIEINASINCTVSGNVLQESLHNYGPSTSYFSSSVWVHDGEGGTVPSRMSDNINISNNIFKNTHGGMNINCVGIYSPNAKVTIAMNDFSSGRYGSSGSDILSKSAKVISFANGSSSAYSGNLLETNCAVALVSIPTG